MEFTYKAIWVPLFLEVVFFLNDFSNASQSYRSVQYFHLFRVLFDLECFF